MEQNGPTRKCWRWLAVAGGGSLILLYLAASQTRLLPAFWRLPGPPAPQPATRDARWAQDLRYLQAQLPRLHVDPFHTTDRKAFDQAFIELSAALPTLSDVEIALEIMRITATIGDAHTRAVPPASMPAHLFPLSLRWLGDGFYVVGAMPGYEDLVGARLVTIAQTPVDQAYELLRPYVAHETETGLRDAMPRTLLCLEILQAAGILDDPSSGRLTLQLPDGTSVTREPAPADIETYMTWLAMPDPGATIPLYRQRADENYWFEYLDDAQALYLRFARSEQMPERPFADLCAELFAAADAHPDARLIVDLRDNGGGSSDVLRPLLKGLLKRPALNQPGRFFVLVDRGTYSAAALQAVELDAKTQALLLGEPPASVVDHYGQVKSFQLPNSQVRIDYSTKHFPAGHLAEGKLGWGDLLGVLGYAGRRWPMPEADMGPLRPDVWLEPMVQDYLAGRDPVLEAALAYPAQ